MKPSNGTLGDFKLAPAGPATGLAGADAQFDSVVFAGGGNRCFWQAGFWTVAAPCLGLKPACIAAVSAGSAIACALFSGTFEQGFAHYLRAIAGNERNFYPRNLWRRRPAFPHGDMYRDAILRSIDWHALQRLHQGPEILILVSCPPRWANRPLAMLMGAVVVAADAWDSDSVHCTAGLRLGFKPLYLSIRECGTPEALADLIIASSCVPPLTPQAMRNGMALFDGGLVSNVPTECTAGAGARTLVLLTRKFPSLPEVPGRTYVQPSRPIPVGAWDYTNRSTLQATFDLGQRDGEAFARLHAGRPGSGAADAR